jgi:DNA-binding LacI/PurR family transcriptional regulator
MSMRITINDVAKYAKVSKATVSRVLNNKGNVSPEVAQRVKEAVEVLNYVPSGVARSLVSKTTGLIGLVIPDIVNPFFPMLARGVEDAAHRLGFTLLLCNTDNDLQTEQGYINKLQQQRVEGIILVSSNWRFISNILSNTNFPIVACDRFRKDISIDSVVVDNYRAGFEATEYLISKGHRDIVYISTSSTIESIWQREQGYLAAMSKHSLNPNVQYGTLSIESGYQITNSILRHSLPSAIFTSNDLVAFGAMRAIHEKGLSIPDDIALLGCDDIVFAEISNPSLSTIRQPVYQMGVKAMELLYNRIHNYDTPTKNITLKPKLILRESTEGKNRNVQ